MYIDRFVIMVMMKNLGQGNENYVDEEQKIIDSNEKDFIQEAEHFGDSTTLHGVQYILGSQKHYLRR